MGEGGINSQQRSPEEINPLRLNLRLGLLTLRKEVSVVLNCFDMTECPCGTMTSCHLILTSN